MDTWHATFLGRRHLPREITAFEVEVFFQFTAEEARIIDERRRPELKLGLPCRFGFLRMSGRLLDAVRIVPPLLWRIAPTRTEGINLRGVFRFPVERYADKILPSAAVEKTTAGVS
jgi:hypothetical protein